MAASDRSPYIDWTGVTDADVDDSLRALLTEKRMNERWLNLTSAVRSVHMEILLSYVQSARPPTVEELTGVGTSRQQIDAALEDLERRDLVVFRDGIIQSAYPYSSCKTRHSVKADGVLNWTVCFIDALGTAAMTGKAASAYSACPVCNEEISVEIREDGLTAHNISPPDLVVWAGVAETGGCAADTQCQTMLAFCSDDHLDEWKVAEAVGFRLSPMQAVQVGAAIFRPFLLLKA